MQTDGKSIEIQGRGMECQQTIANLSGPTCNVLPGTSAVQHNHKWCNTIQYIRAVYVCVGWWVVRGRRVQEGGPIRGRECTHPYSPAPERGGGGGCPLPPMLRAMGGGGPPIP